MTKLYYLMSSLRSWSAVVLICATSATLGAADDPVKKPTAADKPAESLKPTESLDDELLKGLGGAKTAKQASETAKPTGKSATTELDDELLKDLGGPKKRDPKSTEKSAASDDPIERVTGRMREVEELLRQSQSDASLRPRQAEIVRELTELIRKLNEQQAQQSPSKSSPGQSSKPEPQGRQNVKQPQPGKGGQGQSQPGSSRNSSDELKRRRTEEVDMAKMQEMLKDIWGQLPPRLREQMLQSGVEKFVPKYELLIEEYFKTLAERQTSEGR